MSLTWLNYHHLFYFKVIAEQGTVSRASGILKVGQPALSAQLKSFEDQLGFKLFDRQKKRLVLTEQGNLALEYAQNIFKMGSEMIEVLNDRHRPAKPSVHLGAIDGVPKNIIVSLTEVAQKLTPCQVTVSEGKPEELLRELAAHRMDLVVTNFIPSGAQGRGFFPRSIGQHQVSFYGTSKFSSLKKTFPKSLSDQPLILPSYDSQLRYDIELWANTNNLSLNVVVETQDISVKKLMARSGMGLIPGTAFSVTGSLYRNELIEIGKLEGVKEELFLISAQRKIENKIAAHLKKNFKV